MEKAYLGEAFLAGIVCGPCRRDAKQTNSPTVTNRTAFITKMTMAPRTRARLARITGQPFNAPDLGSTSILSPSFSKGFSVG